MTKTIYLDMDGTIADLYMVEDWLEDLENYNPRPYQQAKPMVDMAQLNELIGILQEKGFQVGIVSWLSKTSTKEYDKAVRQAKKQWLKENLPNCKKNIHIVKYGTKKSKVVDSLNAILFDDEEQNRVDWRKKGGLAFDPQEISINKFLEMIASI